MNLNQLSKEFDKNGYIYIESFFSEDLMDAYQEKILNYFALNSEHKHNESFIEKSDTDVIPWFPQLDANRYLILLRMIPI